MYGTVVGNVCSIIDGGSSYSKLLENQMSHSFNYSEYRQLPKALKTILKTHFEKYYEVMSAYDETEILGVLPQHEENAALCVNRKNIINQLNIFKRLDRTQYPPNVFLLRNIKPFHILKKEILYTQGSIALEAYFLMQGALGYAKVPIKYICSP